MPLDIEKVLNTLERYGIRPSAEIQSLEGFEETPEIGSISEDESVYSTSIEDFLSREGDERLIYPFDSSESGPRIREWQEQIKRALEGQPILPGKGVASEEPEPHCAWYSPIHYFGYGWGIYIREECVLRAAINIASFVNPAKLHVTSSTAQLQLVRAAFYTLFFHEQFHHKVESLGFRILVTTGQDRYSFYKKNVYRKTFLSPRCIEESLANAESVRRLSERRYRKRLDDEIYFATRQFLMQQIPNQAPGYAQGINFITESSYRAGLETLQSQVLDGRLPPSTPPDNWRIAPNMIAALADITEEIYVVLPKGARPLFPVGAVDPAATVSSNELISSLTRNYGYTETSGGKGSHVKLTKMGKPPVVIPGGRSTVSPGVVKHVLKAIGGYPLSRARDFVMGTLPDRSIS